MRESGYSKEDPAWYIQVNTKGLLKKLASSFDEFIAKFTTQE